MHYATHGNMCARQLHVIKSSPSMPSSLSQPELIVLVFALMSVGSTSKPVSGIFDACSLLHSLCAAYLQHATLMVRPRGWHLQEKHILVDGQTASGALMDFAIFFFNSAHALIKSGSGKPPL